MVTPAPQYPTQDLDPLGSGTDLNAWDYETSGRWDDWDSKGWDSKGWGYSYNGWDSKDWDSEGWGYRGWGFEGSNRTTWSNAWWGDASKDSWGEQRAWDTWGHDSCNKDWRYEPADSTKKPELWKQTSWYKALQRKTTTDMPTPRKTPPCKLWKGSPKVPSGSPAGPMEKQVLDEAMEDEIKQDVQEMKGKRKSRARYMRFYRGITGVGLLAVAVLSC